MATESMTKQCAWMILVLLWSSCLFAGRPAAAALTEDDYSDALDKCLLYFEGQRSGPLPATRRNTWRGDSGLKDGSDNNVDLVGGYYDAGDNVKFGLPMAFTATLLSWGIIEYGAQLEDAGQLDYALEALKWITDYLLKAVAGPTQIWVQVGDATADHACWERPEDMDTSRLSYQINAGHPGSEPAAETAAALAAGYIAFKKTDLDYANSLLEKAEMAFSFADTYRGSFGDACPYYCSFSGYLDELLWGAAWLYRATKSDTYLNYVQQNAGWSYSMNEFLWDNKLAGVQVLLSKFDMEGIDGLSTYRAQADAFICTTLPASSQRTNTITPGGLLYVSDDNNMQYVTTASLLMAIHSDYLNKNRQTVTCGSDTFQPSELYTFAKRQADYILGDNPLGTSFMTGFGSLYPTQLHHRGASIVSYLVDSTPVGCSEGYSDWYNKDAPNPNVHIGAIVGGPNNNDEFSDKRNDWDHLEGMTYINAPMCSLLAKIRATKS
ncbi:unnamed protein product [Calypogeia fissa]